MRVVGSITSSFSQRETYFRAIFAFSRNLVVFDEGINRIPILNALERLYHSNNSVRNLRDTKLLTRTDPRPTFKGQI